jgi:8-oxo-dGTP pyrophosphatase MutT (NUDIX family)
MQYLNEIVQTPLLDVVRVVCLNDAKEILLVQESDDPNWKLPGGKMHTGETVLAATQREIVEELGCPIQEENITRIVKANIPHSPNYRYIILARLDPATFTPTSEVAEYRFYPIDQLPATKFQEHILSAVKLATTASSTVFHTRYPNT